MKQLLIILIVIGVLIMPSCSKRIVNNYLKQKEEVNNTKKVQNTDQTTIPYGDINKEQAQELIDSGDVELLDVRTLEEHQQKHIPDSILIPLQELEERMNELDKEKTYIVYCRSGNRSKKACSILKQHGFKKLYNLKGGIIKFYD